MIVDVTKIEDAVMPFAFEATPEKLDLDTPTYRVAEPVSVTGEIRKHIGAVKVTGTISGAAEIDCTRCLKPVEQPLSVAFDVEYLTEGGLGSEGEHEVNASELDTDELPGSELDLGQLAREQILLDIPEQFYCREDCKGLCAKCGADLNLVDCKCGENDIDPRWAALKSLKDDLN